MGFLSCGSVEPTITCVEDSECFDGYSCDTATETCRRQCTAATESADCLASQFCDVPTGSTGGVCRLTGGVIVPNDNNNNSNDDNTNTNDNDGG